MVKKRVDVEAFYGKWIHSYEEDTKEELVYRHADFPFPPSRGRAGFELSADKSCKLVGIGQSDISAVRYGRWDLENEEEVRIRLEYDGKQDFLAVISVDSHQLTIRRKIGR